jgi:protein-serine/threonine kinase
MNLCFSGNIWLKPEEEGNDNYKKFITGWRNWLVEHPDCTPNEETGYPKCGKFMGFIGPPAIKKLIMRMLHPNPDKRITIQEALHNPVIKGAECCAPESFEDLNYAIDVSKKCKPRVAAKQFKHNHLPPKDHKFSALHHRFDMGDGYR